MFNPAQFFAARQSSGYVQHSRPQQMPIVIDQLHEVSRSKWDQPLVLPSVLYSKFNVPMPESEQNKQVKSYPLTLLDYIKRAYQRCKDEENRKIMEQQLRKVIGNFQEDFHQVDWKTYPIPFLRPTVSQTRPAAEKQVKTQVSQIRKGQVRLPSSYNIIDDQNDKPSKAKLMAQKRLEKLQKKLNNQDQTVEQPEEKKFFIGFQSRPDPPVSKFQTPHRRVENHIGQKISFPLPSEQTKKKNNQMSLNFERQKSQAERSVRSSRSPKKQKKSKKQKKLKEEKLRKDKLEQLSRKKQSEKKRSPIRINRTQLQLISKSKDDNERLGQVARRFAEFNRMKSQPVQNDVVNQDNNLNIDETLVGKNQNIEKPYLRITGRPNPDSVRPEPVLRKAIKFFLDKYKKGCDYDYLISQLKSIRQDLTVQHIKNSLTVQVYEQNMRISLFEDDIAQFKHCQTTLWQLYCQGLFYTKKSRDQYMAYQMITLIMEGKFQDMEFMLVQIPEEAIQSPRIQDCLKLKRLMMVGNYRGFFNFLASRDTFSRRLLNLYTDKVRVKCLLMVCKTFGQKISLKSLAELIGEDEDILQTIINQEKGIMENGFLILKPSYERFLKSEHLVTRKVTVLMG